MRLCQWRCKVNFPNKIWPSYYTYFGLSSCLYLCSVWLIYRCHLSRNTKVNWVIFPSHVFHLFTGQYLDSELGVLKENWQHQVLALLFLKGQLKYPLRWSKLGNNRTCFCISYWLLAKKSEINEGKIIMLRHMKTHSNLYNKNLY